MTTSPFHIYYKARQLASYVNGDNRLLPAFASANIKIYPYQIAAALFAMRSPYINGVILADEGSLGKTYEALLIATQRWYEGKTRQLLVLPTNLVRQWIVKIETGFTIPFTLIDAEETFVKFTDEDNRNPFEQDGIVLTTYDFAVEKADYIQKIKWDLAIFDEASCLNKSHTGENKTANVLKEATEGAFRLLLTPTPITMSIMDIYGLLHVIDESILPDEKEFYERYFRKPENYPELSGWVSKYCLRTLKSQVTEYVNFPNRIPFTCGYELTSAEKGLYKILDEYFALPKRIAYPKMERYELTLMYYHTVSSSPQALCRTLDGAIRRVENLVIPGLEKQIREEIALLTEIRELAASIEVSGKMKSLLSVMKKCLARLGQVKAQKKVVIFTDNRITQKRLYNLLTEKGYEGILTYSGDNGRDYSIMEQFRNDKNIQILISTDEAAKGLDIEFCPVVINYDLLYNAIDMEQRITRCHRQGQQSDVVVINLLGKDNFSDVRILELIKKRVLQFDGIFGMSDDIIGNFDVDIDEILANVRHRDEIEKSFGRNLQQHKETNSRLAQETQNTIFTSFTKSVADKLTLTPQYIEEQIALINEELWQVVKWYFEDYNRDHTDCQYLIDDHTKTVTAQTEGELPDLFYYWSGSRNRPYRSLRQYGMGPDFRPHSGRITLTSVFGRNVLDEVYCETGGTLTVAAEIEPCSIALYSIKVFAKANREQKPTEYFSFLGQTASGRIIPDEECRKIMELPVVSYTENRLKPNIRKNYNSRNYSAGGMEERGELDSHVPADDFVSKYLNDRNAAHQEEIENLTRKTAIAKTGLEREVNVIKSQIKQTEQEVSNATDRIGKIQADKRLKILRQELRRREDALFLDRMRLDLQLEEAIKQIIENQRFTAEVSRHYLIEVGGQLIIDN